VIPALLEVIKNECEDVRTAAARALGQIGHADPQAVIPHLLEALKDEREAIRNSATEALQKYDLSLYLKSQPNILADREILTSTHLTSLFNYYKDDRSPSSVYYAAITKKCIEENLPFFRIENAFCCYEQSKLCAIDFPNPGP
jgi:hypothetical protein